MDEKLYQLALLFLPKVGPIKARSLVSYVGSPEAIFRESKKKLEKIPGIGTFLASEITKANILNRAETELKFIEKNNIEFYFYLDKNYPKSLSKFEDAPVGLFVKGNLKPDFNKTIGIVGTRGITHYGEELCQKFIRDIVVAGFNPLIISGLAYGVDALAHNEALRNNLITWAILGTGLDRIYPAAHTSLAERILQTGALITEFPHTSRIDPANFIRRNRIIAALSNAVIVVETPRKGGSLITAEYAVKYSKDVYTFPCKVGDSNCEGNNFLIKTNRAALIENADDFIYNMSWVKSEKKNVQAALFVELSADEQKIVDVLKNQEMINVDNIAYETKMPINKILSVLFSLEFKDVVKSLPGRMYKLLINR